MKKVISILLSVIIMLSAGVYAVAENSSECGCGYVPVIYVTGFNQTPLVADKGEATEHQIFPPQKDTIVSAVKSLAGPALSLMLTWNRDAFAKTLVGTVNSLFEELACDENGVPVNSDVDIEWRQNPTYYHEPYYYTCFRYDWRQDVFDLAAQLNDFIEETKRLTGHSKVALKVESMGGSIVMTYLGVYGHDSIDSLVMQSSAGNGLSVMGSLYTGDININAKGLVSYLGSFLEGTDNNTSFDRFLYNIMAKLILVPIGFAANLVIKDLKDILYEDMLRPTIGQIPGLWTFVPEEYYEDAKAYMLDEKINAELIRKIDRYHYDIARNTKTILDAALADGVNLAIISNYGKGDVPVGNASAEQSDSLVETSRTSFGATCAPNGKTFGEGYVQKIDDGHNRISPDNIIDASTCMYPDYTWFVKDMIHTWYDRDYVYFTFLLIYHEGQETVDTFPEYPQFLVNNHAEKTLEPLTKDNADTQPTDFDIGLLIKDYQEQKAKENQ